MSRHTRPEPTSHLQRVVALIDYDPTLFMRAFSSHILHLDFSLRELFPGVSMSHRPHRFPQDLTYVFTALDKGKKDAESISQLSIFLEERGRDNRKFDVTEENYASMQKALLATLEELYPEEMEDPGMTDAVATAFSTSTKIMLKAAKEDPHPARLEGTVLETIPIGRTSIIVRLKLDEPLEYMAGQYMAVQIPQAPGLWRYLSAANPSNFDGYLEFHIRALPHGQFSNAAVRGTRVGDKWTISTPLGSLSVSGLSSVCMIARNVGIAAMRCILVDMVNRNKINPTVDVYYGAATPGELFDASTLANLKAANPWLDVQLCVEETEDPWWLRNAPEIPSNLTLRIGSPLELAIRDNAVKGREILVGGGPQIVEQAERLLPQCGVRLADIHHDPL